MTAAVVLGIVLLARMPNPGRSVSAAPRARPVVHVHHRRRPKRVPHPTTTTTTTTTIPPAKVSILVANGTSVGLGATHLAKALAGLGYHTLAPANTTRPVAGASVYYAPGYDQAAAALAARLGLGPAAVSPIPTSVPVSSVAGADVVVIEGRGLARRFASSSTLRPRPGSPTTTTT